MFKDLLKRAQDIATPERIAALKQGAAKAAAMATATAETAAGKIERVIEDRAARKRQEAIDTEKAQAAGKGLSAEARMVLQRHAERQAAHETDTRIRGAGLIDLTSAASQKLLRDKTPPHAITIGGVPIDSGDEQQHILLAGAPGTGKSVEIKKALRTIRSRRQRAVVYDPSGEFTSMFYRPGVDVLLNPLDQRCAKWNLWADAESFEYAAVAASFIPDSKAGSDPFWTESARAVFESLLSKCSSIDEVVYTGLSAPIKELARLVHDAGFGGVVGPENTFMSTRATLATYLRSLSMLENAHRGATEAFSFRRWAEDDTQDAWIFLTVPAKARDAIRPLASLFLDTAVRHIMSLRPDPQRRIWLEIDELPSLQSIPSLSPALAEGRKYGIGAILGVQSFHQLKKSFGDDLAQALWGLPKTRLYLRISDAETADMISRELGEVQLKRKTKSSSESSSVSTGQSVSSSESSSTSESEQFTQERIVLPAEIMGLPDLTGYLRTGGSHRVAKVKVNFDGLPRFGDQEDFIWKQQRPLPTAESIKNGKPTTQEQVMTTTTNDEVTKAVTTATETTPATVEVDDAAIEEAIRSRALELMQESMAAWADEDVAALSDEEMAELTSIFVERAAIEITGVHSDVSAS